MKYVCSSLNLSLTIASCCQSSSVQCTEWLFTSCTEWCTQRKTSINNYEPLNNLLLKRNLVSTCALVDVQRELHYRRWQSNRMDAPCLQEHSSSSTHISSSLSTSSSEFTLFPITGSMRTTNWPVACEIQDSLRWTAAIEVCSADMILWLGWNWCEYCMFSFYPTAIVLYKLL